MRSRTQYCLGLVGLLTAQGALGQVQPVQSNDESEQATPDAMATSPANSSEAVTNSGEPVVPASPAPEASRQSRAPTGTLSPSASSITPSAPAEPVPVKGSGQLFIGVPVGFLAQQLQDEQGLSGRGWGIDIGLGVQYSWLNLLVDFGFEHYNDKKEFRQTVIDSFGDVSVAKCHASRYHHGQHGVAGVGDRVDLRNLLLADVLLKSRPQAALMRFDCARTVIIAR